jgi:hypothetical protein
MKKLQSLYQGQRNLHVYEIRTSSCDRDGRWEMGEENERKKGKKVC